jgi:hypothetical protein
MQDCYGLKIRETNDEITLHFGPLYGDLTDDDESKDLDYAPCCDTEPSEYNSSDESELGLDERTGPYSLLLTTVILT